MLLHNFNFISTHRHSKWALKRAIWNRTWDYAFFVCRDFPIITKPHFGTLTCLTYFSLYLLLTLATGAIEYIGFLIPVATILCISTASQSNSLLSSRPFVFLGGITFTIYLIHMPLQKYAISTFGIENVDGSIPAKISLILISILGAWLLSITVERRANRLGHLISNSMRQKNLENS